MTPESILKQFDIPMDAVVNIYPYGSRVYGSHTEGSDHDWIIVYRSSLLPSGAFRDNAISSADRKHQAICYSRSGFRSGIDAYDVSALECMFLKPEQLLLNRMDFSVRKWNPKEMASALITKSSSSWYQGITDFHKWDDEDGSRKNIYHALRILGFGIQMADSGRIMDYSAYNALREEIMEDADFTPNKYLPVRDNMIERLRAKANETIGTVRTPA